MGRITRTGFNKTKAGKMIAAKLTSNDVFYSSEFYEELVRIKTVITKESNRGDINLFLKKENPQKTAATNGRDIEINLNSSIVDRSSPVYQYLSYVGFLGHELGHCLFNDFKLDEDFLNSLGTKKYYPKNETTEEIINYMAQDTKNLLYYKSIVAMFTNIIDDAYVEYRISNRYEGVLKQGIAVLNLIIYETNETEKEKQQEKRELSQLEKYFHLCLYYKCSGKSDKCDDKEVEDAFYDSLELINELFVEKNYNERLKKYGEILSNPLIWKMFKAEIEELKNKPKEGNSNNQESDSDGGVGDGDSGSNSEANDECKKANKEVAQSLNSVVLTTAPVGSSKPVEANKKDEKKSNETNQKPDTSIAQKAVDILAQNMGENMAVNDEENKIINNIRLSITEKGVSSSHTGIAVNIITPKKNKEKYMQMYNQISNISKSLQREIKKILKYESEEGKKSNLVVGRHLEARSLFRDDMKNFSKNKNPIKSNEEIVFFVLLDQSGSMSGEKIVATQKCAIILEDFARTLNIPCQIMGHNTKPDSSSKNYKLSVSGYNYTTFNNADDTARYRLSNINASDCNRDGLFVDYACKALSQRPEKNKILIVISDGEPNHTNYCGDSARDDIRKIIQYWEKKSKIRVFGADLENSDSLKYIYQKGYFNISELDKMPKILTSVIKKYLV